MIPDSVAFVSVIVITKLAVQILLLIPHATSVSLNGITDPSYDLSWVSSGGGWLAMSANMGYANLFSRASLVNQTNCKFSAISTYSGASWFSTQFFYSQPFFDVLVNENDINQGENIRSFLKEWMDSYITLIESVRLRDAPLCRSLLSPLGLIDDIEDVALLCQLFASFNGDVPTFFREMFRVTSTNYGDPTFVDRVMDDINRLPAFQQTDHHVLTGISETARVLGRNKNADRIVYVSPFSEPLTSKTVYTVPIPYVYTVSSGIDPRFSFATEPENLPLYALSGKSSSRRFHLNDWDKFYLYPGTNGSIYNSISSIDEGEGLLSVPFGGKPATVSQIVGATACYLAFLSGLTPSFFAHDKSPGMYNDNKTRSLSASIIYKADKWFHGTSMCSQWPNSCGTLDGRFIDGGFTEGLGLAVHIGRFHTDIGKEYLNKTLKIIVTENDEYLEGGIRFFSYFNTSYNVGIAPGDFIWAPGFRTGRFRRSPWRSMQIFNRYLDYDTISAENTTKINGTNLTATYYELTTIENRAYGVQKGQRVQILHLQVNADISPTPFLRGAVQSIIGPLGQLASDIATSSDLLAIIQDFVNTAM